MVCWILFLNSVVLINSISAHHFNSDHHREKRFLIFPRGNPTRHQFIAGIGFPVDLTPESMTVGYVFKGQYFLPYNVSQLYPTSFEKRSIKDNHFSFMRDEFSNSGPKESLSFQTQPLDNYETFSDNVRWSIYEMLGLQLQKFMKIDGIKCIQMFICEASQSSFSYKSGILSEILHIFLVPSTTSLEKNVYSRAEEIGRKNFNCQNAFPTCKLSLINYLSSFHV